MPADPGLLDDPARLRAADPGEMLRSVAASAAHVREAEVLAQESGLERLAEDGRPRGVVTVGLGACALAGDVLAAVAGTGSPVPLLTSRSASLPGWVGAVDLVVGVSAAGTEEEPLAALEDAVRRGARVLGIGAADSPLAQVCERGRGVFVPVRAGRPARGAFWSLAVPLLAAGVRLGLVDPAEADLVAAASRLEDVAVSCSPDAESFTNPAKLLAGDLAGALPMLWGTTAVTALGAHRAGLQVLENAKAPALWGVLPEAAANQVAAFDGPSGAQRTGADLVAGGFDIFADPDDHPVPGLGLHLVLIRDADDEELPAVAAMAGRAAELARDRGLAVTELAAAGTSRLERLASVVGLLDHASVYLAVLYGVDPTPVDLAAELARPR